MNAKVVPVKMPGFDQKRADAFVRGEAGADVVAIAVEQQKMKRFTIDVPLDLHARVKIACARRNKIMADVLREILEREFPAA